MTVRARVKQIQVELRDGRDIPPMRLAEMLPGKTLILVTHRSSLLSLVDRLVVVDGGKVVADGPREQVVAALDHLLHARQLAGRERVFAVHGHELGKA